MAVTGPAPDAPVIWPVLATARVPSPPGRWSVSVDLGVGRYGGEIAFKAISGWTHARGGRDLTAIERGGRPGLE